MATDRLVPPPPPPPLNNDCNHYTIHDYHLTINDPLAFNHVIVLRSRYGVAAPNSTDADFVLLVDVTMHIDPSNTTVRLSAALSALEDLTFCLGGVSLLNLTVPHSRDWEQQPVWFHGSTGGWLLHSDNDSLPCQSSS